MTDNREHWTAYARTQQPAPDDAAAEEHNRVARWKGHERDGRRINVAFYIVLALIWGGCYLVPLATGSRVTPGCSAYDVQRCDEP